MIGWLPHAGIRLALCFAHSWRTRQTPGRRPNSTVEGAKKQTMAVAPPFPGPTARPRASCHGRVAGSGGLGREGEVARARRLASGREPCSNRCRLSGSSPRRQRQLDGKAASGEPRRRVGRRVSFRVGRGCRGLRASIVEVPCCQSSMGERRRPDRSRVQKLDCGVSAALHSTAAAASVDLPPPGPIRSAGGSKPCRLRACLWQRGSLPWHRWHLTSCNPRKRNARCPAPSNSGRLGRLVASEKKTPETAARSSPVPPRHPPLACGRRPRRQTDGPGLCLGNRSAVGISTRRPAGRWVPRARSTSQAPRKQSRSTPATAPDSYLAAFASHRDVPWHCVICSRRPPLPGVNTCHS